MQQWHAAGYGEVVSRMEGPSLLRKLPMFVCGSMATQRFPHTVCAPSCSIPHRHRRRAVMLSGLASLQEVCQDNPKLGLINAGNLSGTRGKLEVPDSVTATRPTTSRPRMHPHIEHSRTAGCMMT